MLLMFAVMYFLLIRPQQKRQREQDQMLKSLKRGDNVRTTGGIRGEIAEIDDREVMLIVADRVKINVLRSHITGPDSVPQPDPKKDAKAKDDGKNGETSSKDRKDKEARPS